MKLTPLEVGNGLDGFATGKSSAAIADFPLPLSRREWLGTGIHADR